MNIIGKITDYLSEDMMEVLLDNQILICVGWYPDEDINGSFLITVSKDLDMIELHETQNVRTAQLLFDKMVEKYNDCALSQAQCQTVLDWKFQQFNN